MALKISEAAKAISERTRKPFPQGAYSADRYTKAGWTHAAEMLLRRGFTGVQVEEILRSKLTRWAGDASDNVYGRCTGADIMRYVADTPNEQIISEWCGWLGK